VVVGREKKRKRETQRGAETQRRVRKTQDRQSEGFQK
jgi:hypothetical protein